MEQHFQSFIRRDLIIHCFATIRPSDFAKRTLDSILSSFMTYMHQHVLDGGCQKINGRGPSVLNKGIDWKGTDDVNETGLWTNHSNWYLYN